MTEEAALGSDGPPEGTPAFDRLQLAEILTAVRSQGAQQRSVASGAEAAFETSIDSLEEGENALLLDLLNDQLVETNRLLQETIREVNQTLAKIDAL